METQSLKRQVDKRETALDLEFHPLTPELWADLEKLFGRSGACGGCWCMWWRLPHSEFAKQTREERREALKNIVDLGEATGILAYVGSEPVGWCSVAPRETYRALERSRLFRRVDDKPVWSVACFFVARRYRRMGVIRALLNAAVAYVKNSGGRIVEGYPVDTGRTGKTGYMGSVSTFQKAGFVEVARRSKTRAVMRRFIEEK